MVASGGSEDDYQIVHLEMKKIRGRFDVAIVYTCGHFRFPLLRTCGDEMGGGVACGPAHRWSDSEGLRTGGGAVPAQSSTGAAARSNDLSVILDRKQSVCHH